ncbi:hypothetical protein [Paraburkholderia caffeinilytica]|uniref:hypothetical protein n=1 Tax=Paraburkholderia caffeinilytica TaxID=1761016 RepID=UPI0038BC6782
MPSSTPPISDLQNETETTCIEQRQTPAPQAKTQPKPLVHSEKETANLDPARLSKAARSAQKNRSANEKAPKKPAVQRAKKHLGVPFGKVSIP